MVRLSYCVVFLLFLPAGARRSIRIDGSHHDAKQQNNMLANGLEVSAQEAKEEFNPFRLGMGVFHRGGPAAGVLREGSQQDDLRVAHDVAHRAALRSWFHPHRTKVDMQAADWPVIFALIWSSPAPFVYETIYGGAERAPAGRSVARLNTKAQALALGKRLEKANPAVTYSLYKINGGEMTLLGAYPKRVNVAGARIKFRRRRPPTGGANDATLGVGGMGEDIWRELLERDGWGEIDDAWKNFRRELELTRDIEVVDERGDPVDSDSDYVDDEDAVYD